MLQNVNIKFLSPTTSYLSTVNLGADNILTIHRKNLKPFFRTNSISIVNNIWSELINSIMLRKGL
jgi:hypothetical protein